MGNTFWTYSVVIEGWLVCSNCMIFLLDSRASIYKFSCLPPPSPPPPLPLVNQALGHVTRPTMSPHWLVEGTT